MPRFSARNIFRTQDGDINKNTGEQYDPEFDIESIMQQIDAGGVDGSPSVPDNLDAPSIDTPDTPNSPSIPPIGDTPRLPDAPAEEDTVQLPTYPTTLAKGTFALPGSGSFRQYQSAEDRAPKYGTGSNASEDKLIRRLRGAR